MRAPPEDVFDVNDSGTFVTTTLVPNDDLLLDGEAKGRRIDNGITRKIQSHQPVDKLDPKYLSLSNQLSKIPEANRKPFFESLSLNYDLTPERQVSREELGWLFSTNASGSIAYGSFRDPNYNLSQSGEWLKSGDEWKLVKLFSSLSRDEYSSVAQLSKQPNESLAQLSVREKWNPGK